MQKETLVSLQDTSCTLVTLGRVNAWCGTAQISVTQIYELAQHTCIKRLANRMSPGFVLFRKKGLSSRVKICDLSTKQDLEDIYQSFKPDIVINLAAQGGVRASQLDPEPYIVSNQLGFFNLLQLNNKFGIKLFVYASSSSVYGDGLQPPFIESSILPAPKSLYAASKLSNELMAEHFPNTSGPRIGLRFFTVYGPWGRPDMAVSRLLSSSLVGNEFVLTANKSLKRDFTFVEDLTSSVAALIHKKVQDFHGNEIFNIACQSPRSLSELLEICKEIGLKSTVVEGEVNKTDVRITHGSSEKLAGLGISVPTTSLEDGLLKTTEWMKSLSDSELRLFLD
jgi:UDP-glucuronate 4-epimerase